MVFHQQWGGPAVDRLYLLPAVEPWGTTIVNHQGRSSQGILGSIRPKFSNSGDSNPSETVSSHHLNILSMVKNTMNRSRSSTKSIKRASRVRSITPPSSNQDRWRSLTLEDSESDHRTVIRSCELTHCHVKKTCQLDECPDPLHTAVKG